MIPFQIHRRLPLVRRPFFQRDEAIAARDAAYAERDLLRTERDRLRNENTSLRAERDALSGAVPRPGAHPIPLSADTGALRVQVTRSGSQSEISPDMLADFQFRSGDELRITPLESEASVHRTPDGHYHLAVGTQRYRLPTRVVLTAINGYLFPEHLVVLTGAGTETLDVFGKAHVASYMKFMGLQAGMTFLEIGCGIGRDALQLIDVIGEQGRFIGIDVTWDSIEWCRKNIAARHGNFEFHHFDVTHELYNPLGLKSSLDFALPAKDHSVDRISAGSVFTHLFEDEIVHYMKEIARVLKPDGLAYATFFLYSTETIAAARRTNVTHNNLMFAYPFADGCFVNDSGYPTGAVAFTNEAMQRMISRAGLRLVRPYLKGAWSGLHSDPDDGQEVAILAAAPA